MRVLAEFTKQWLIPGSLAFLFLGLAGGVVLLNAGPSAASVARVWLTMLAASYWLLSLPAIAALLINGLGRRYRQLEGVRDALGAKVLVIVGNGSVHYTDGERSTDYLTRRSVFSVFEGARLFHLLNPELVVATGGNPGGNASAKPEGDLIRELLVATGVPAERIVVESASSTTAEQVTNVIRLLRGLGHTGPFVIVTTPAHMPRVMRYFEGSGFGCIPSVTPELRYDDGRQGWRRWWPTMSALIGSASAIYEHLAGVRAAIGRGEQPR